MSRQKELETTLRKIGAIPYRRFGKIRIAVAKEVGDALVEKAMAAVRICTDKGKIDWDERPMEEMMKWHRLSMLAKDVCDDPIPEGIDQKNVDVRWLLEQCRRYHFRLTVVEGKLTPVPDDGYKMDDVKKNLPSWFMPMCSERKTELIGVLSDG